MLALPAALLLGSCGSKYSYESVPGDPMGTRIYTLDNGLKVYLSVNKDAPRIQTIVAVNAGGGVDFNGWSEDVESVLMAWHPGQEGGQALAEILTGKTVPSGKLPISIENRWEDNPVHESYYDKNKRVTYTEGVFVGYRGYDRSGTSPRYPFGYGLSYTDFEYSGLEVKKHSHKTSEYIKYQLSVVISNLQR